jgi:hypothetical protein
MWHQSASTLALVKKQLNEKKRHSLNTDENGSPILSGVSTRRPGPGPGRMSRSSSRGSNSPLAVSLLQSESSELTEAKLASLGTAGSHKTGTNRRTHKDLGSRRSANTRARLPARRASTSTIHSNVRFNSFVTAGAIHDALGFGSDSDSDHYARDNYDHDNDDHGHDDSYNDSGAIRPRSQPHSQTVHTVLSDSDAENVRRSGTTLSRRRRRHVKQPKPETVSLSTSAPDSSSAQVPSFASSSAYVPSSRSRHRLVSDTRTNVPATAAQTASGSVHSDKRLPSRWLKSAPLQHRTQLHHAIDSSQPGCESAAPLDHNNNNNNNNNSDDDVDCSTVSTDVESKSGSATSDYGHALAVWLTTPKSSLLGRAFSDVSLLTIAVSLLFFFLVLLFSQWTSTLRSLVLVSTIFVASHSTAARTIVASWLLMQVASRLMPSYSNSS